MEIKKSFSENKAVFALEGRLDTVTAPQLENEVNNLPEDVKELVFDMEKLEYVSSAGLRVILAAQKKMSKVGSLKLVSICDVVMEVFEITGFSSVLNIE